MTYQYLPNFLFCDGTLISQNVNTTHVTKQKRFFPAMPLNPVMFPRRHGESRPNPRTANSPLGITAPLLATAAVVAAVATLQWPRRWLLSGCGVESLVLIYGSRAGTRILGNIPLWTILATLNVIYAVSSTSWLLYLGFTAFMVPCVGLTCLLQFTIVADFVRKNFRNLLKQLHFTRDKIALFNLPAMEIDTEVDGLMVIRGLTIQLSSLTAVAHGIELGKQSQRRQVNPTKLI
jgi:hypothetical protein